MTNGSNLTWTASYTWGIAGHVRCAISTSAASTLPTTVLCRLDPEGSRRSGPVPVLLPNTAATRWPSVPRPLRPADAVMRGYGGIAARNGPSHRTLCPDLDKDKELGISVATLRERPTAHEGT